MTNKMVVGIGINDAGYGVTKYKSTGEFNLYGREKFKVIWRCPYYAKWKSMLERCYSTKCLAKRPTYEGCSVCNKWLLFSNFRKWMEKQDWEGKHLDKDLLFEGNKIYSDTTCIFVHMEVNEFTKECKNGRGKYLLGCNWNIFNNRFISRCNNPFIKDGDERSNHIGYFDSETEAHLAWKKRKYQYACELANSKYVIDDRVRASLLTKYQNYNIVEDHIK